MSGVQDILHTATIAQAATLGSAESSKNFKEALKGSIVVDTNLKSDEISYLVSHTSFPLVFRGAKTVTTDHALMVAMRAICRVAFEKSFKVSNRPEKCLVIGSSAREMRTYSSNPNIHHFLANVEGKDVDRIVVPVLQTIMKELRSKTAKADQRVFIEKEPDTTKMRPSVKRYWELEQMLRDLTTLKKLPCIYHTFPVEATTLLFEDSIYNFDEESITKMFLETGATIAFGYALMPMELVFQDMAPNRMYRYWETRDVQDVREKYAHLTFRNGYSNGYSHRYDAWSTLLKKPVLKSHGITLAVEICARVGCMAIFKIYRSERAEKLVRTIELADEECFVRLLDLWDSVDHHTCKLQTLKYFSVRQSEWFDTLDYLLGLDPKSISFPNTVTYVRRRMGGASLVSRELIAKWDLTKADVYRFCMVATLQAYVLSDKTNQVFEFNDPVSVWERISRVFGTFVRGAFYPLLLLYEMIVQENLTDKLALYPVQHYTQKAWIKPADWKHISPVDLNMSFPNEEEIPKCPVCRDLHGKLGKQKIHCSHKDQTSHVFKLSAEEVEKWRTELCDDDNDPPGLKAVKEACKKNLPNGGFEHECDVFHLRGGPGTGKSHIIRTLADEDDLIYAPMTKLMKDYKGLEKEDGEKYDLFFQTTHRGVATAGGRERVFLDEWTCMDYRMLALVIYKNQAKKLYMAGDERQTHLIEPDEGIYIGNRIDLTKISTHELLVNFRNPIDTVALLNKMFGYTMEPVSTKTDSIKICDVTAAPPGDLPAMRMGFTKASAKMYTGTSHPEKNTVRANQGGTSDSVILYVTEQDARTSMVECLQIVALSRHTDALYIVSDGSNVAKAFLSSIDVSEDFKSHIQQFLHFPNLDSHKVMVTTKDAEIVLNPVPLPGKDSYFLSPELTNPIAVNSDVQCMNQDTKILSESHFRSAKSSEDQIFGVAVNKRGHPAFADKQCRSIGAGLGVHFEAVNPFSEFAVFAERYDDSEKKRFRLTPEAKVLADAMVDEYFEECKFPAARGMMKDLIDDEDYVKSELDRFCKDMKTKHYSAQFGGYDNVDVETVRFHIKTIFKPENTVKDMKLQKCGQGIAAFNTDLSSFFCFCARLVQQLDEMTDRADNQVNMISTLGKSDEDFVSLVTNGFKVFTSKRIEAPQGIMDAVKMDSMQDEITQYIEYRYNQKLGVSQMYLDWYFRFRRNRHLQGRFASAKSQTEKNSGEPWTFYGNDILTRVFGNYILRGQGPMIFMHAGDDGNKVQLNLQIDEQRQLDVKQHCSLTFLYAIRPVGEFCGNLVTPEGCFPNLRRKHEKLIAKKFRDYGHFCEYQKTLRNVLQIVNSLGLEKTVSATAINSKCSWDEANSMYQALQSWSHVNFKQFTSQTTISAEGYRVPRFAQDSMSYTKVVSDFMGFTLGKFVEWRNKVEYENKEADRLGLSYWGRH